MTHLAIRLAPLFLTLGAFGLNTEDLVKHGEAKALLQKKCIRTELEGNMNVSFDAAATILGRPNLLDLVQQEYARSVSKNGTVDIPVTETAPGQYHYFNSKGKRTDIRVLHQAEAAGGVYDYILQASGKRFFGRYDVVVHFQMLEAEESGVSYITKIHAYPHNGALRFFARKLGTVERYFKKNADKIGGIAQTIGEGLTERKEGVLASSKVKTER